MIQFELPTTRIEYLDLALPAAGTGLVAKWGTQTTPYTIATWDAPGEPPTWQLTDLRQQLSPDGEWASVFDRETGEVRVTSIGANRPAAVLRRKGDLDNVWTAVAPGGTAVAWKDGRVTVVSALPGGEPVARVKSGWGYDLRFSPGGRWLTEVGERVFRVFDRTDNYRVFARIPIPRHAWRTEVNDRIATAVVIQDRGCVAVWDMASKSTTTVLPVGEWVSALALSTDGRLVLTGNPLGEVTVWDAAGPLLRRFDWGVKTPIAAAFSKDGLRAAVGGTDGRVVVWDLDQ
jgi:WD40 repeat protein